MTTYPAFSCGTLRLTGAGAGFYAAANAVASAAAGLAAVFAGMPLADALGA